MSHILVVGGTGMLRGVCLHFCKSGNTVTVIARNQKRLESLKSDAENLSGTINPLSLDYRNAKELSSKLFFTIEKHGPIEAAVCWIHTSEAPDAARVIAEVINEKYGQSPCEFYLLLSSATADHAREEKDLSVFFTDLQNISLHTILLGFVIEKNSSRWPTDDEICRGVIKATEEKRNLTIIGTVNPWDQRP